MSHVFEAPGGEMREQWPCGHSAPFGTLHSCDANQNTRSFKIEGNRIVPDQKKADLDQSVEDWWTEQAAIDVREVAPKAMEYGSNSLMQLGYKLAALRDGNASIASKEELLELGCWINLVQKVERWTDAVYRGERPSDDTLKDIEIYAKMARRIRQTGDWP